MVLPDKKSAFTLIELLLVVTIISIITVGVVPAFSNYIRNQNLKQAQEQLKSDMRSIQNKALTGALSDQLIGESVIKFWGMNFTNGSSVYDYFISVLDTTCPASYDPGQYQGNGKLTNNLKIFGVGESGCLFFSVKDGGITPVGSFASIDSVKFVLVGYSPGVDADDIRHIYFNTSGLIYTKND